MSETTTVCRRCTQCEGEDHHWDYFGDEDEAGEPVWSCKHCDARKPMDDDDEDDEDGCCPGCGACPGFTGVECDGNCAWALADAATEGKAPHG